MKKITLFLGMLFGLSFACHAQTARLQVIHNAADTNASVVDVYLNGTLLLDDFAFRTSTPFIDAPAGVQLTVDIAPANSTSVAQSIYSQSFALVSGETYIAIANGIVSASGYTPNQPFTLYVQPAAREEASVSGNTDVLVFHGATDAPTVDVQAVGAGTVVDNLGYGNFNPYLELPTSDYVLNVTTADGNTTVASYAAPLASLGLQGQALTVLASGFLDPSANSDGPAFGLWAALASGGPLVELPTNSSTMARVQIIHNSADAAAAVVDIYVNGELLLNDVAYRTASPFVDAPAGTPLTVGIAPGNSTSASQSVYTQTFVLEAGESYVAVANGIVSGSGYIPNQPFNIYVQPGAREAASNSANTDVLVFHGATDAPTVDVQAVGAGTVVDNLGYGNFNTYLELPTSDYVLSVTTADGNTTVASYSAPLASLGLQGQALTVLASGFLDPSANSDGPAFGLWAALPTGGALIQLPVTTLGTNETDRGQMTFYPNPASSRVNIYTPDGFQTAQHNLIDSFGKKVLSAQQSASLDVSGLPTGIYLLESNIDGRVIRNKIAVAR